MSLRERFVDLLPKQAFRIFAGRYVAGDSMESALQKSRELASLGVASTIDVLGEDVARPGDIEHYVALYTRLSELIASDSRLGRLGENIRPSISLKPSMFVMAPKDDHGMIRDPSEVPWDDCEQAIRRVVARSSRAGVRLTIDMENHQWTDFTLALYRRLFAEHGRLVGTVLQSRLDRTPDDIESLPDGCRVRLCLGIYDEPSSIATRSVSGMKERMLPLAERLLEKDVYLEFATHDLRLIHRFVSGIVFPGKIGPEQFETQGLLGVPRQNLIAQLTSGDYFQSYNGISEQLRKGIVHRLYVPFAEHWDQAIAYSRRRLRHSPNLFWTGFVNAPRVLYYSVFKK